jgi:cullin 1
VTDYLQRSVLADLLAKRDELLLRGIAKRWENHKIMNKWMKKFFSYLVRPSGSNDTK